MKNNLITWDNLQTKKVRGKRFIDVINPYNVKDYDYEEALVKFSVENIARANYLRACTVDNHLHRLYCLVYSYNTKYEEGYIRKELDELLSKFPDINMDKFDDALAYNTCMLKGDDVILYHCDVLTALRCGIENRNMHVSEWD